MLCSNNVRSAVRRSSLLAIISAAALIIVAWLVPGVGWRVSVLWHKANGDIQDIGWRHLLGMLKPGSDIYVEELAATRNPYRAIHNPKTTPADIAAGIELFRSHCASCHGDVTRGGPGGPALVGRTFRQGRSDWALFRTVTLGIEGTAMAARDLPAADVWRIIGYLNSILAQRAGDTASAVSTRFVPLSASALRSLEAPAEEWLTYSGSYDSRRHSALAQIERGNVHALRIEWLRQFGAGTARIQSTPLVRGSMMFVTSPPNHLYALDTSTGQVLWTYSRPLPSNLHLCCSFINRGVALLGDKLFLGTLDGHLVALDAATGKSVWEVKVADHGEGYSITGAPLALDDKVVTGVAGGEFGTRGFLDAYDAATGKRRWRLYTVPAPGEPGSETWRGDSWKTGGAPTWLTGSFDPELRLIYWPTGNPAPNLDGRPRGGDNLYSNSLIAVDADTGAMRWHFQFIPHDEHDWDCVQVPLLIDAAWPGSSGRLVALANRNAFFYVLDRGTGKFLSGTPFARQTWTDGLDAMGRPRARPEAAPTEQGTLVYPSATGATNWWSPAYSPASGLVYVPTLDSGSIYFRARQYRYRAGETYIGGGSTAVPNESLTAAVKAIELTTGRIRWEYKRPPRAAPDKMGGLLSTAGGIVFGGDVEDFFALDAATGAELWRIGTGGNIVAAPISYLADGRQFVTVASGSSLITFALPEQEKKRLADSR